MDDRQELRRRLRAKIKNKREGTDGNTGPQLAQRLRADPKSAMLSMGVDDVDVLNNADSILKDPERFLRQITGSVVPGKKKRSDARRMSEESDEEAPPPEA